MHPTVLVLIVLTCLISYMAFENSSIFERYKFNVSGILQGKQFDRMFSSGFLHVDFQHLLFNMITLYFFADIVVRSFSAGIFLLIYFASMLGGSLLGLLIHKNKPYYSAVGASGAVSGIIYAAIATYPNGILIYGVIPGWIFGIGYLFYSIYGMQNGHGNIGHSAHLGGAVVGLLFPLVLAPSLLSQNLIYILLMLIPVVYLLWVRGCLIQNHNRRIFEYSSGDAQSLFLTTREFSSRLTNIFLQLKGQFFYKFPCIGYFESLYHFLLSSQRFGESQIIGYSIVKQD
ncbi:MAG: rhomboid family intramembrane serine protease [Flavobacteriaceae bacterium]|nr:MAG: rhomboid family intramembrane serine protease [Flavobacteriaceae bacterium]